MLYKDACNRKSNQQNLGTIHCSNLCTEIVEYTDADEVAVCNLASVALSAFATAGAPFNFQGLYEVTKVVTRNLNKVIDGNYYPIPEARASNMRHRPIGIGVQGLADAYMVMKLPFESEEARLSTRTFLKPFILQLLSPHVNWLSAMVRMRPTLGRLQARVFCSLTCGTALQKAVDGIGQL